MLAIAILASGFLISGCSGGGSEAPTNTANSKYNDSGQTDADKVAKDRAKAHMRLPHGGQAPTQ